MSASDLTPIIGIITRLDSADGRPARFSYTQAAFDSDTVEGVDSFSISQEQNVPKATLTDYASTLLDRGARTQGASIPRMAWDHFIGRFSYNLAKLTQKFLAYLGLAKKAWAHNAFEYDGSQAYLQNDVCYIIGTIGSVSTVEFYKRVSASPLELSGVSPVTPGQTDWAPVQYRTEAFPLLTPSADGYKHRYSVVDLTGGGFLTTTWYPVTTEAFPAAAVTTDEDSNTLQVQLEAYVIGAVAGQADACRAELSILARFTKFAASTVCAILNNSFVSTVDGNDRGIGNSPIGFSVLPKGQQAVMWLRGGSKYALWNSYGADYTVRTASYANPAGDTAVAPSVTRVYAYNPLKIWASISSPDAVASDEVVNLGQVNGNLTLPIALVAGQDLNALPAGSYYTPNTTIADSILHPPVASPGVFSVVVTGNKLVAGSVIMGQTFTRKSNGDVFSRVLANGVEVIAWSKIWTSLNDGSGSGLDADTLDGQHGSYYWSPANDGSGSGLDADTLDGQHGSYYWSPANDGPGSGLDADTVDGAHTSIDGTFAANSDLKIPTEKAVGTKLNAQAGLFFTGDNMSAGTEFLFPVPAGSSKIMVSGTARGGTGGRGGNGNSGTGNGGAGGGGGGGAGEAVRDLIVPVTPGDTLKILFGTDGYATIKDSTETITYVSLIPGSNGSGGANGSTAYTGYAGGTGGSSGSWAGSAGGATNSGTTAVAGSPGTNITVAIYPLSTPGCGGGAGGNCYGTITKSGGAGGAVTGAVEWASGGIASGTTASGCGGGGSGGAGGCGPFGKGGNGGRGGASSWGVPADGSNASGYGAGGGGGGGGAGSSGYTTGHNGGAYSPGFFRIQAL